MFEKLGHAEGYSRKVDRALVARGQVERRSHAELSSQSRISDSDVNPTNTAGWKHRQTTSSRSINSVSSTSPPQSSQVVIGVFLVSTLRLLIKLTPLRLLCLPKTRLADT
ncbi:unnamed protein product [Ectocarpus sp. 12 AP-2014]